MRETLSKFAKSLPVVFVLLCPLAASADELSILDCAGNPRAVSNVAENSESRVIAAVDQQTGGKAVLNLLSASGEVTADVSNGRALFDGVKPGAWSLCPSDTGLSVSEVSIIADQAIGSNTTAAVLGAGLLATGAVLGFSNSDGGGNSEPARVIAPPSQQMDPDVIDIGSPSESTSTSSSREPTTSGGSDGNDHLKPSCAALDDCLNDESPAPFSPIS